MEEYFTKLSQGFAENFSDEQREAMRREHGFETSGPALKWLKKWLNAETSNKNGESNLAHLLYSNFSCRSEISKTVDR